MHHINALKIRFQNLNNKHWIEITSKQHQKENKKKIIIKNFQTFQVKIKKIKIKTRKCT